MAEQLQQLHKQQAEALLGKHDHKCCTALLHAEGVRSGKLLSWLVKEEQQSAPVRVRLLGNGTIITCWPTINATFHDYYYRLYAGTDHPTPGNIHSFLCNLWIIMLNPLQKAELDEPLQLKDIRTAISQIAYNKTVDTNWLLNEYYATFFTQTTQHLLYMFISAKPLGRLPV
ncbi:hypothetical protein NDU88_006185 [Pleurodeles waltl]|uniref:Uncharacterized protein n=1 Tax=Pleurodeles waltl TaxID=8319 RepID=A0AAV7SNY1_PLEWA|nr:hypothetical protein NDU88_006185 [Pleurodeles waltl]